MSLETLSAFFGWMSVLNIAYLMLATLTLMIMRGWVADLHHRLFGIEKSTVETEMYRFVSNYKVAALIFSVAPWLALQLI